MVDANRLFQAMVEQEASDLFLKVGSRPFLRINGTLIAVGEERLSREELLTLARLVMPPEQARLLETERELNFAFERLGIGRFRANLLYEQGHPALVIRRISGKIPGFETLNLPAAVLSRLAHEAHGLILVTGATGMGKSTTVASIVDSINHTAARHILTLEDPIEFVFEEDLSIISQREIGADTQSFSAALKNALRQSPDVLFISDLRDQEAMESALVAAEAGALVVSCVHTTNILTTIERVVTFFPPHQQTLVRHRLSLVLKGIVSQRLLARADGSGRIPACEVLLATPTVQALIREGETQELRQVLHEGGIFGMQTLTQALYQLYRAGDVTLEEARQASDHPEEFDLAIREIRATKDVRTA